MLLSIPSTLQPSTDATLEAGHVAESAHKFSFEQARILSEELNMWTPFASPLALLSLPPELIDRILCNLDLRSLLKCKEVCKKLKERIEKEKGIQYIMELEISGLEMNPHNDWAVTDCFKCLEKYRSSWERLDLLVAKPTSVPYSKTGLWELSGGVLAQTDENGVYHFLKLPSSIRHIQEESWEVTPDITDISDFGMDPAQNLFVWVTAPTPTSPTLSLHLRTLKAGKHPNARHDVIRHDQCTSNRRWFYSIQIMQDYIGLLAYWRGDGSDFFVWNWKEDRLELDISLGHTQSFSFVSDRHVVLADKCGLDATSEVYLTLIDFKGEDSTRKPLREVRNSIKLCYPSRAQAVSYEEFNIVSEPTPGWTPGIHDKTPFFVARENRVFTVSIRAAREEDDRELAYAHFIPIAVFKKCLERLDTSLNQELKWSEWAPEGTRLIRTSLPSSLVWGCFVFGARSMTSVMLRRREDGQIRHLFGAHVYDFNQLALRREKAKGSLLPANCSLFEGPERLAAINSIWTEIVETSLPFKRYNQPLPVRPGRHSLMLTSDHIVLVNAHKNECIIFAF